ncbi:MAG: hypothetical protein IMW89_03945 [Ktedonobacteraceae bacterium]|nr:hypothetical protein [Ktedonobacteraceae bacterium]
MRDGTQENHQFDSVITTLFTCRGIIKYNSTLSEEQKQELTGDIDAALRILRAFLAMQPSVESVAAPAAAPPRAPSSVLSPVPVEEQSCSSHNGKQQEPQEQEKQEKLRALYRMYYTYLHIQKNKGIQTFVLRFNEAMGAISQAQALLAYYQQQGSNPGILAATPLERVATFVSELYSIFIEFVRALSEALEANNVHLDTEELLPLQSQAMANQFTGQSGRSYNFLPLMRAYEAHQQTHEKRGRTVQRVDDAIAFIEFLQENIPCDMHKREEFIGQLDAVARLLKDLSLLLVDYELAVMALLHGS